MFGRTLFFVMLIIVGAVVPYLMSDDRWLNRIEDWTGRSASAAAESDMTSGKVTTAGKVPVLAASGTQMANRDPRLFQPGYATSPAPIDAGSLASSGNARAMQSSPAHFPSAEADTPLPLLLSFDVTPQWITSNWDHVTTRLAELGLQGWRVPYTPNSRMDDFAGSITYYFDRTRRVQRIVLHGYTSEPAEIVQLATSHYQMRRMPSPGEELFLATVANQPVGGLQLCYAPVLNKRVTSRGKRCELLMEINRQGSEYGMSYEFSRLLRRTRETNELLTPIE